MALIFLTKPIQTLITLYLLFPLKHKPWLFPLYLFLSMLCIVIDPQNYELLCSFRMQYYVSLNIVSARNFLLGFHIYHQISVLDRFAFALFCFHVLTPAWTNLVKLHVFLTDICQPLLLTTSCWLLLLGPVRVANDIDHHSKLQSKCYEDPFFALLTLTPYVQVSQYTTFCKA